MGLVWLILITGFDYHHWVRFAWWLYAANLILLVSVIILGRSSGGAVRWLSIGGFQFQPSELSKIILILGLTRYLTDVGDRIRDWKRVLGAFILIGIPMILIMKQPDLGTALILIPILYLMLYVAGANWKHLAFPVVTGLAVSPVAYAFLKTYQKNRLLIFLDPQIDPLGAGYNVIQSKIAVGSGQFMGKGLLQGSQSKLDFLPANHTDFAFSTFAEQFGFIGTVLLLLIFAFVLMRMLSWTKAAKDRQGVYIIVGAVALLLAHVVINVGMTLGIMPVTGLPLPFISYGGSSYLTFMTAIGLAINVHQRRYTY